MTLCFTLQNCVSQADHLCSTDVTMNYCHCGQNPIHSQEMVFITHNIKMKCV